MPKSSRIGAPIPLTRKQISRREKEQRSNRVVLMGAGAVLGIVVLILAWGLYDQYVLRPRYPVATVSGVPIRLDIYQKLVKYRRWDYRNYLNNMQERKRQLSDGGEDQAFLMQYIDQQIQQIQGELMNLPTTVLDELIDDELARQECARRSISVGSEDVQLRLEQQFGYERNPPTPVPVTTTLPITVTPTPTTAPMTQEEFTQQSATFFKNAREAAGFIEQDFRKLLESALYRQKLEEVLRTEVPTTTEQIHARAILLQSAPDAEAAMERINKGEDFAKLATELTQDSGSKDQGGDLGWFPRGATSPEIDEGAFALQPGQVSGMITTTNGVYLIKVEERDANHPLDASGLGAAQNQAIQDWFDKQRSSPAVVRSWDSTMIPRDTTAQELLP